jgi:hypothetical protein
MTLRNCSKPGAMPVHPEVLRADELPAGVPGPTRPAAHRDGGGRFRPGPGTAALASTAGKAAHESRQLAALLGLWDAPEGHPYAPYARLAREWRDAHMATLSATVAGGSVGPGPASVVSTAALQMAASRWLYDLGVSAGDPKALLDASKLADSSRQNLLAAHELAAREAQARPRQSPADRIRAIAASRASTRREDSVSAQPTSTSASEVNGAPTGSEDRK